MSISDHPSGGVRLDLFANPEFDRGASRLTELVWLVVSGLLVDSWLPGSGWRCALLRCFGAQIGVGAVIKPRVRVKFPWRLKVGANAWIGEGVWIDNLDWVVVGANSCLSQGSFLCTGSHDWSKPSFDLITKPITIGEGVWVCARGVVGPGTTIKDGVVLTFGSLAMGELSPDMIYSGAPATSQKPRRAQVP